MKDKVSKIIYGFLMLMPIMAVGVTCAYTIFNDNAKDSYYGETINEYSLENVNNVNDFDMNNRYVYDNYSPYNYTSNISENLNKVYLTIVEILFNNSSIDLSNVGRISFYGSSTNIHTYFYDTNDIKLSLDITPTSVEHISFIFTYVSSNVRDFTLVDYACIKEIKYNNYSFLSDTFYYSIDRTMNAPIFNWVVGSPLYNGFAGVFSTIGVNMPFLTMYISYWLYLDLVVILPSVIHWFIHFAECLITGFEKRRKL